VAKSEDATQRYRTIFLSDLHLGTRGCQAELALDFLLKHDGKAFTVSEYDHPAPSHYAAEMFPMIASFAAVQDWDGFFQFAWGGTDHDARRITGYFSLQQHPGKLAFLPAAALMLAPLPNTLNVSCHYVEGEGMLYQLSDCGICASSGSACTSATLEPSYVLKALGLGDDVAHSSIRFGLGRFNTQAEVDYVAAKVIDVVKHLRKLSPLYEMVQDGIDLTKIQWAAH